MSKVPTLSELHEDHATAKKLDELNTLLNQPCPESWVKKHPMYGNKYLPIDKVEWLLIRIFGQYRIEIMEYKEIYNSVGVHVRVHYRNPVDGEWYFHDGVGAATLQLDSGAKASDMSAIKNNAVMLALPIAETQAIKDACNKFGRLFGKDLNRKDTIEFQGFWMQQEVKEVAEKMEYKPVTQKDIKEKLQTTSNNDFNPNEL